MPEINEQNTNSALEERLSTFRKINSSMIAVNDTAYDTYGFGSRRYRRIEKDRERILEIINEGHIGSMRELSRRFFDTNSFYRRILTHYATILQYSGLLIPKYTNNKKSKMKRSAEKAYIAATKYCDNSNFRNLFTNCTLKALIDGAYYGFILPNVKDRIVVMDLPAEYCRSRFKDALGNEILEFNINYFDTIVLEEDRNSALKNFPPEIARAYKRKRKGEVVAQWQTFPTGVGFCFTLFNGYPPFVDIIPAIMDYDDSVETEKERDEEEIKKILVQKIPHNSQNDFLLEPDEVDLLHEGAVGMMKHNKNVSVLTTYADVDAIISKTAKDNSDTTLSAMLMNIYSKSGTSEQLFASNSNLAIKYSLLNDTAYMMVLADKYSNAISSILNIKFSNNYITFKYQFLPITAYNGDEYVDTALKLGTSGYSFIMPALAMGLSQSDLVDIKSLETEVLGLDELLVPLASSYTQSEKEGAGAPQKKAEDKADKTIANEKSLDKQGGN